MKRILFELSTFGAADPPYGGGDGQGDGGLREGSSVGFAALSAGRFRKELIREGTWVHPTRNFRLSVTVERMRRWVEKFRLMQKRGIRVPVPFGHSYDPKDNAGFVEELVLSGNVLTAVLNVPRPEDAEKLGRTVKDVSISVNPDFRDGQGRRYGEVIEHVALTTQPVVSGQTDFVPLALPDGSQAEVWIFAVESLMPRQPAGAAQPAEETPTDDGGARLPAAQSQATEAGEEETVELEAQPEPRTSQEKPSTIEPANPDTDLSSGVVGQLRAPVVEEPTSAPKERAVALARELSDLRQQELERELAELLRSGRLTPAMRGPAHRLLALREPVSFQLADGQAELDVAAEVRALLSAVPEHALIDLRERTLFEAAKPVGEMTDERAAKLAAENRQLAKLEG